VSATRERKASARAKLRASSTELPSGRSNSKASPPTVVHPSANGQASAGQTITTLIDATLARTREADPHVIARRLLPKVSAEDLRTLALAGLVDRVSKRVHLARELGLGAPVRREGRSRWQVAQRVCAAGEWRLLEDCGVAELDALIEQHEVIVAQNAARADEYRALRAQLVASGCATVGEFWAREDLAA
jgi:hypothetical protein